MKKNYNLKKYFDGWDNRCYILVDELDKNFMYSKYSDKIVYNLELNTKALKELGCKYILSGVKIDNYAQNNLNFEKLFLNDVAYWKIYLYKIIK